MLEVGEPSYVPHVRGDPTASYFGLLLTLWMRWGKWFLVASTCPQSCPRSSRLSKSTDFHGSPEWRPLESNPRPTGAGPRRIDRISRALAFPTLVPEQRAAVQEKTWECAEAVN
jgi:hypothetical protein